MTGLLLAWVELCTRGGNACSGRKRTRSARLSSSWPIMLLFFLQRATLPSMKSKNRPKGRKARAA